MLSDINFKCDRCRINKRKKVSFKTTGHIHPDGPLDLLFADMWVPNQREGCNGERYFLTIIEDFSRRASVTLSELILVLMKL